MRFAVFLSLLSCICHAGPTYYVSLSGNNTTGLSWQQAFTDLQNAVNTAHLTATQTNPSTVIVDGNVFDVPNGLIIRENVNVIGQGAGASVLRTGGTVFLEWNCSLSRMSLEASSVQTILSAMWGGSGQIQVSRCIIDGEEHQSRSAGAPTIGIMVRGGAFSSVQISDCAVSNVDVGILTIDSGVNIARCLFNDISQDAVMATTERFGKENQIVPTVGIAQESETTGLNWYRNVEGFCVNNQTDAVIRAEVNDWYKYTSEEVAI